MLEVQNITQDPLQKRILILPDATQITMTMYFVPMQFGWFITSMQYGNFTLKGLRISNQPNMLRQWKNLLPFGLACFSDQDREPSQLQDFSSGKSKLYILTSDEVAEYEAILSG